MTSSEAVHPDEHRSSDPSLWYRRRRHGIVMAVATNGNDPAVQEVDETALEFVRLVGSRVRAASKTRVDSWISTSSSVF